MIATDKPWRYFEPCREAVEAAQEAKEREKREAEELYWAARRAGMPASGRWA